MSSSSVWGIRNVGNSCFLNVSLQLLSSCPAVLAYLESLASPVAATGAVPATRLHALVACLALLSPPRPSSATTADLALAVDRLISLFFPAAGVLIRFDQSDAHETLLMLLEAVSGRGAEGLKVACAGHSAASTSEASSSAITASKTTPISPNGQVLVEVLRGIAVRVYGGFGRELKVSIGLRGRELAPFCGSQRTERRCVACGTVVRAVPTPFFDLSLPLEDRAGQTVEALILAWLRSERLDGVGCEKCQARTSQIRQISIDRAPEVLLVHFLRQVGDGSHAGKIQSHVAFKTTMLLPVSRRKVAYTLRGVVVHHGGGGGGHYSAFRREGERGQGGWVHISDSEVLGVNEEQVLAASAYQLAFERAQ